MSKRLSIVQCVVILFVANQLFAQVQQSEFEAFMQPVGNWLMADNVRMDAENPETLNFETGISCIVNGESGKAKYLVTKKEYSDLECYVEFMLPKGSNSGIYVQCRYEIQLFDSWGATDLTYYDCGGIQQGKHNSQSGKVTGFDGYAPKENACKEPGIWQSLEFIFRAPKFNSDGKKIRNAAFEKVVLNGKVIHQNIELPGPTKGALSEIEVQKAPFRLQGGHGPVAFRKLKTKSLD